MTENKNDPVSVIISVYNGEKYLAEMIESVVSHNYPNIEIIIVDDGSTDYSGKVAQHPKSFHSTTGRDKTGSELEKICPPGFKKYVMN
jgi:cellulose synthase/poly-beta-1,6-N-acetylglucosamine synthase-like glycosyltransferase